MKRSAENPIFKGPLDFTPCVLVVLGYHEGGPAFGTAVDLQRGVSPGVEQRLHDRGTPKGSSAHQGGTAGAAD